MLWTDLELDRIVPDDQLGRAWATVFGVGQDQVVIVDDLTETAPWVDRRPRIVLERRRQPGDFPLHITVVLGDDALDAQVAIPAQSLETIRRLCAELGCRALISDDDPNPYRWILITPEEEPMVVRVDPQQLDDSGAIVLERVAAATGSAP